MTLNKIFFTFQKKKKIIICDDNKGIDELKATFQISLNKGFGKVMLFLRY